MDSVQAVDGDCQSAAGAEKVGFLVKESVGVRGENECFGWEKGAEREEKQVCCGEQGLLSKQEVAVVTALAQA